MSQEVRIVYVSEEKYDANSNHVPLGLTIDWDPEKHVESVRVHPEADDSFMESVTAVVGTYASVLKASIAWSDERTAAFLITLGPWCCLSIALRLRCAPAFGRAEIEGFFCLPSIYPCSARCAPWAMLG
jgi:hypothetical protein